MPKVTLVGGTQRSVFVESLGKEVRKGHSVEVSQEWIDEYAARYTTFVVGSLDDGDGLPDSGWSKKDITAWLAERGSAPVKYATKGALLGLVKGVLNPPAPAEEAPAEVTAEEPVPVETEINETEKITGDE
jgi:hypothetical protein